MNLNFFTLPFALFLRMPCIVSFVLSPFEGPVITFG